MSRIGKKAIPIPNGVKVEIKDGSVFVQGPKGALSRALSHRIKAEIKDNQIIVQRITNIKLDKSLHGLYRALIMNMVKGVTEGYRKELEVIGVGYRVGVQGNKLNMQLGFTHQINLPIPEGIKIETPKQNQIIVTGIDKEKVGEIAAQIRAILPPEPYKGTGIRYKGEYVKKKIGKAQAGAAGAGK